MKSPRTSQETPTSTGRRVILTHPEHGVYLGTMLGLGFWSQLDAAGQDCAPTFESAEIAKEYASTWDVTERTPNYLESLCCIEVDADMDGGAYASMSACIKAGAQPWADLEAMTTPSMSIN